MFKEQARPGQGIFLAIMAICIFAELFWLLKNHKSYTWKDAGTTFLIMFGQRLLNPLGAIVIFAVSMFIWDHRVFTMPLRAPWAIASLFLFEEFLYYWFHRVSHERRWLWATHAVHHSSSHMNLLSSFRLGWTGLISGSWVFFMPMIFVGFHPKAVFAMVGLNLLYQFFMHTEAVKRIPGFEYIFNTPSHHRVHHANNKEYRHKNFGGVLIIFDRMFGTFAAEKTEVANTYGLYKATSGFSDILFGEWKRLGRDLRRAQGVKHALRIAFGK